LRLMYCYPDRITDELLEVMRDQPKVLPYMDIPLQHCNEKILRAMNRKGNEQSLRKLVDIIRFAVPDITLRTTMITGFPGEGEAEFEQLSTFVKDIGFDRLGCFAYSPEEDTPAAKMDNQLPAEVKDRRAEIIATEQSLIAEQLNNNKMGKVFTVLTEGYDGYIKRYYGRSRAEAPEVDGKIFFSSREQRNPGDFCEVKITGTIDFDLSGEEVTL